MRKSPDGAAAQSRSAGHFFAEKSPDFISPRQAHFAETDPVRIIAGEFRHRRLLANPGLTTRPITDRAKEILFERIQDLLVDKRVVDIFAGTGSLGLEALSRGAQSVVFLESDKRAFELLEQNVAALGVEDRALCWRTDALNSSFHPKGVDEFLPFEVVFFDPPYRLAEKLRPESPMSKALVRLARNTVTADTALLFFRVPKRTSLELPACWEHDQARAISSMEIHVFKKATERLEPPSADPSPIEC